MNKQLEILERRYKNIKESSDDWHFFLGIADYVNYLVSQSVFELLLQEIIKPRKAFEKEMDNLEIRAIKELDVFKGKLLEIIKKSNIKLEEIDKDIKEYEEWKDGQITGSRAKCEGMENNIRDILIYLWQNGQREIISEYIRPHPQNQNIPDKFIICDSMDEWYELQRKIENEKDTALWEDWNNLTLVHLAIYEGDEEFAKARKEKKLFNMLNLATLLGAMRDIKEKTGENRQNTGAVLFFNRAKYLKSLDRIHLYLIENIFVKEEINIKAKYKDGILYFMERRIDFRTKANQKELLDVLFEEPEKEWFYDEIQAKWDEMKKLNLVKYPKNYWKKFYTAGDGINTNIARQTTIPDFIEKTTKKIWINKKYSDDI